MVDNKEKQILNFIKFAPAVSIIVLSIFITFFMIYDNKKSISKEVEKLKSEYLQKNKQRIVQEVERAYNYIVYRKTNSEKNLKDEIKSKIYEAYSIIESLYYNNKEKDKKEIIKLIKNALQAIRFNEGRGYYFIYDTDGINLLHPIKPELEGKNLSLIKDVKGDFFAKRMIESLKHKDEGYAKYYWYIPQREENKQYKKFVFYKIFRELGIVIATGEYLDDFEADLKKEVLEYLNSFKYGKGGYIFVIDNKGTTLAHINEKFRNLKLEDITNEKQIALLKDMISKVKKGDGFLSYLGEYNNHRNKTTDKVSYIKAFKDWNWIIGTGFYQDELALQIKEKEKQLMLKNKENLYNILILSSVITVLLLIVSIYVSKILQNMFDEYKEQNKLLTQQSKMATMGEMIANIAHQWRQPLNMISTAASSMKFTKDSGLDSKESDLESIDYILKSTKHLSQTIDDFRNYFSPNKERTFFNIKDTYNKIIQFISSKFKNKEIIIIDEIKDVQIESLENELIQAILNILNNAYDIFEEKEMFLRYLFITIKQKDSSHVEITIKDNAGGIPEDVLPRIFEPYFTTKHQSQGTGIGLYMTYNIIVSNLKGKLEVSNESYEYQGVKYTGAQFKITLLTS